MLTPVSNEPRFVIKPDGSHSHHIVWHTNNRFVNSLNGLFNNNTGKAFRLPVFGEKKMSAMDIKEEREAIDKTLCRIPSDSNLVKKWGSCQQVIGKGAFGVVRLARKTNPKTGQVEFYAVKVNKNNQVFDSHEFNKTLNRN
jgi:protein-serine/threonine kinase